MTDKGLQHAARVLVASETYREATDKVIANAVDRLLNAKTPEERETKWQEYAALKRVREFLAIEAQKADQ